MFYLIMNKKAKKQGAIYLVIVCEVSRKEIHLGFINF